MKVLIDTCVILDYIQGREPFFDDALNIMIDVANNEIEGYITASSMTDLYYIIHRHTHSRTETSMYLSKLIRLLGLLDTTAEDCLNALHKNSKDFEDAVMMETAHRSGMDLIITRNVRDYEKSAVRAVTPGDYLLLS